MATVTSLPELVTGLSAITIAAAPDLAVGDALGSCVFNLAILAVVDVVRRNGSFYAEASRDHVLSAAFGIGLLAMAGIGIATKGYTASWSVGHVSAFSLALILACAVAMRKIFRAEQRDARPQVATPQQPWTCGRPSAATPWARTSSSSPASGCRWSASGSRASWAGPTPFVGTLFIALAMSTPEPATTLAAAGLLRYGFDRWSLRRSGTHGH